MISNRSHVRISQRYRYRPFWALALAFTLALSVTACGGTQGSTRESLPMSVDDFHSHLVWGRYSEAAGYLPVEQRGQFLGMQEEIGEELRYTEYEIGSIDICPHDQEAIVTITLKWYRIPQYTLQTTRIRETWTYDEDTEFWWLTRRAVADNSSD